MIPIRDNIVSSRTPFVCYALLTLNVAVYLWQMSLQNDAPLNIDLGGGQDLLLRSGFDQAIWRFGLRPIELSAQLSLAPQTPFSEWITLFSSMFMHGGLMHLGGNMLFLWVFADNIEDALGHLLFLAFYLLGGLAAAGLQIAVHPEAITPMVGASGAIAAVLGGYLMLYPRARVLTVLPIFIFLRFFEIPAIFFLGIWFLFQLLGAPGGGSTAFYAHIGGFVFGLLTVRLFLHGRTPPQTLRRDSRARPLFGHEL